MHDRIRKALGQIRFLIRPPFVSSSSSSSCSLQISETIERARNAPKERKLVDDRQEFFFRLSRAKEREQLTRIILDRKLIRRVSPLAMTFSTVC